MALDTQSLLYQLSPNMPGLDLSGLGGGSLERQRLALARQQFEEERKRNAEVTRHNQMLEAAAAAREQLQEQRAEQQRQDTLKASALQAQQEGALKFGVAASGPNAVEDTQAMMPYLASLGTGVDVQTGASGLPTYRLFDQKKQDAEDLYAWGHGPHGLDSSYAGGDAEGSNERGEPVGPPMGESVDLGAIRQTTLDRLNPALASLVSAYPNAAGEDASAYRKSAGQTADAALASGLPADKALEMFRLNRSGPDSIMNAQIMAGEKARLAKETKGDLTPIEQQQLVRSGSSQSQVGFTKAGIDGNAKAMAAADTVTDILEGKDRGSDTKAVNYLMQMTGNKGAQTEQDALRMIGADRFSSIKKLEEWLYGVAANGFSPEVRASILEFVNREKARDRQKVYGWLDSNEQLARGASHPLVGKGYQDFAKGALPGIYDRYLEDKAAEEEEKRGSEPERPTGRAAPAEKAPDYGSYSDFDLELEGNALDAGLDPDKIRPLIGPESGGKASAVSSAGASGVLQIMPDNLRAMGIDPDEYRKLSREEQLPAVMQFLKAQGLTEDSSPDDYALAVAASDPKWRSAPDETVIYPKGSSAWNQNPAWRPADGGDITKASILRYYGLRGKEAAVTPQTPEDEDSLRILGGGQ